MVANHLKTKVSDKRDNMKKYIKNDSEQKFLSFDIYDFVLILVVIIHIWINPYSNSEDEFATNNVSMNLLFIWNKNNKKLTAVA